MSASAEPPATVPDLPGPRGLARLRTWGVRVVAVYLLTRVFSAVLLLIAAAHQGPNPWAQEPTYVQFTGLWWDAGWYERIADGGYPLPVPLGTQSSWAFFPLYPVLVRALMWVTGAGFAVVAPTLSLVAGTVAAALLARVVREQGERAGVSPAAARRRGLAVVLLLGLFPAAPVLQAAYADALALVWVVLALLLLGRRRYLLAVLPVLALGLTRPVALPFVLVVAWHAHRRRRCDPPSRREWRALVTLGLASVVAGLAWPAVTGIAAGRWDAYLVVQEAWRSGDAVAPVAAWFSFAIGYLGGWGVPAVLLAVAAGVAVVAVPAARRLGTDLRAWSAAYLGWLLVAVQPHSSTIRQLVLAVGIPVVLVGDSRVRLAALATFSAVCQVAWVMVLWRLGLAYGWPP